MARNSEATDISGYDPLEGLFDGDDGSDVDPEDVLSEAEEPEEEPEEEEKEEAPPQQPQQPQPYNANADPNVAWARARVLERERDTYRRRLDMLVAELQKAKEQPEPEEEEEDLDFLAPEEKAVRLSEKTLRKIEELENRQKLTKQQQMIEQAVGVADAYIANFAMTNPQYTNAVAHLAAIEIDEFLDENPEVTPQEAEARIMGKVRMDKLKWLQAGKNPGVELWKRAVRRGFVPQAEQEDEPEPTPVQRQQQQQQDDTAQVRRKREKQQAAKTISTMQGAQGRSSLNAKSLAKMSEKDFLDKIADLTKDTPGRRVPSFAELLPGKGYRDRPS